MSLRNKLKGTATRFRIFTAKSYPYLRRLKQKTPSLRVLHGKIAKPLRNTKEKLFILSNFKAKTILLNAQIKHSLLTKIKEKVALLMSAKKKVMPAFRKLQGHAYTNLVGVDIGTDTLKIVKINATSSPYIIENLGIAPIPAGSITKDGIKEYALIGNLLRELFKQARINSKYVALAIPRSNAIIKTINIDKRLTREDIESRAWIEANRHFPDLVGDIHLDFTITGPSQQDPQQLELMLVACRKDQIKPYLDVAKLAGLVPKIVDVNCYALERALPLVVDTTGQKEVTALLNLNMNLSSFIVSEDMRLIHAHDQSYDGTRLITQIGNYLKDKGEVDNQQLLDDVTYYEILKENLISHLRHTVHFFYSSRPNVHIQRIILSGECATTPALAAFIQKELDVTTKVAEPFANVKLEANINESDVKKFGPAMMLCCGLALSDIESG